MIFAGGCEELDWTLAVLFDVILGNGIRLGQRLRRGSGTTGGTDGGERDGRGGDA